MAFYLIQVSDHPGAGVALETEEASKSWVTVWDGRTNDNKPQIVRLCDNLAKKHRHVRAFQGKVLGKLIYTISRISEPGKQPLTVRLES